MHKIQFYHNRNIKQYQSWYSKKNRKFFHIPLRFEQALSLNKICVWPDRRSVVNCAVLVPASWCKEALVCLSTDSLTLKQLNSGECWAGHGSWCDPWGELVKKLPLVPEFNYYRHHTESTKKEKKKREKKREKLVNTTSGYKVTS